MSDPVGLRERKKAQTRTDIAEAALRLAIERGYDAITVADIADAAGVSRRTVSNYFPTKADCLGGLVEGRFVTAISRELLNPEGVGSRARLARAFRQIDDRTWQVYADLALLSQRHHEIAAVLALRERQLTAELVERITGDGSAPIDRLQLTLTLAALSVCFGGCLTHWLATGSPGGTRGLAALVADSLQILDLSWLDPHLDLVGERLRTPD